MLIATASLIGPAGAHRHAGRRGNGIIGVTGVVGALVLIDVFLAAMVIHDLVTRGRLHPVTLWGGGFVRFPSRLDSPSASARRGRLSRSR